jgi:hypothetical protein
VKYIAAVALFPLPFRQWLLLGTVRVACLFMLSLAEAAVVMVTVWMGFVPAAASGKTKKKYCFIP